ncbi:MAG: FemAB family PEP-CTERM system-associated protein [Bdellovibrionales bacterium]|nr:FemAB family PEP-CTERM system-associated protein [Bdellovibrionales bacterium]
MSVTISIADTTSESRWETFAERWVGSHHAYSFKWSRIIPRVFGHRCHYLMAERDGEVVGLLPLTEVRSVLFGKALVSVPYLNAGGILADDAEAVDALETALVDLAAERSVDYCELRHRGAPPDLHRSSCSREHKVSMVLQLDNDAERFFGAFPAKLRSQIRRPAKSGVIARTVSGADAGRESAIKHFYQVFAENMRDLGTPVYPRALFRQTVDAFREHATVINVYHEDRPVAAGIILRFGDTVEIPWASSLRSANKLSPNMLLYWEAIKQACESGASMFDFGRSSPDSGTFRFKRQWGAEPLQLHWNYYGEEASVPDVSPQSPKFRLLVRCWQRIPVQVANAVGPWLTRGIP